ncbi:MAG: restriction endonuclease, partial [Chloroflexota bacterium]
LCEQVVGRGLRRTSYEVDPDTGRFRPEYVNIFGVPFTFLPHEGAGSTAPAPPDAQTRIAPDPAKAQYEIAWPNVVRIEQTYRPRLRLDVAALPVLHLDAGSAAMQAELAAVIAGKPNLGQLSQIDLDALARRFRLQRLVFQAAVVVFDQMRPDWQGNRDVLLAQLIALVERGLASDRIAITPPLVGQDERRRRILLALNAPKIVQHLWQAIRFENAESLALVFDDTRPIRSTADMPVWYTARPCDFTQRSHVNFCVFDSTWEAGVAHELDHSPHVQAWVKNDHLGFDIDYIYEGSRKKYRPDFLIRLSSEKTLVLEVKGQDNQQQQTKRDFLDEWVRAVNVHGGFGCWCWDVSRDPKDVAAILARHDT